MNELSKLSRRSLIKVVGGGLKATLEQRGGRV